MQLSKALNVFTILKLPKCILEKEVICLQWSGLIIFMVNKNE